MSRHLTRLSLLFFVPILLSCASDGGGPTDPDTGGAVALCKQVTDGKVECSIKDLKIAAGCILLAGTEGRDFAIADAVVQDDVVTFSAPEAGKYDLRYTCGDKTTMVHKDFVVKPLTPLKSDSPKPGPNPGPGGGGSGGGGGGTGGGGGSDNPGLCYKDEDCFAPRLCKAGACYLPEARCEENKDCKKEGQYCNKESYTCRFDTLRCAVDADCTSPATCQTTHCKAPPAVCGNGKVETGEECDLGPSKDPKKCTNECKKFVPKGNLMKFTAERQDSKKLGLVKLSWEFEEGVKAAYIYGSSFNRLPEDTDCQPQGKRYLLATKKGEEIDPDTAVFKGFEDLLKSAQKCDVGNNCLEHKYPPVSRLDRFDLDLKKVAQAISRAIVKEAYAGSYTASYSDYITSVKYTVDAIKLADGVVLESAAIDCRIDLVKEGKGLLREIKGIEGYDFGTLYTRTLTQQNRFVLVYQNAAGEWKTVLPTKEGSSGEANVDSPKATITKFEVSVDDKVSYDKGPTVNIQALEYKNADTVEIEVEYTDKKDGNLEKTTCVETSKLSCKQYPLHRYQKIKVTVRGVGSRNIHTATATVDLGDPVMRLEPGEMKCDKDKGGEEKHCGGKLRLNWFVKRPYVIENAFNKENSKKGEGPWIKRVYLFQYETGPVDMITTGMKGDVQVEAPTKVEGSEFSGYVLVPRDHYHSNKWRLDAEDFGGTIYAGPWVEKLLKPFFKIDSKKHLGCFADKYRNKADCTASVASICVKHTSYGTCYDTVGAHGKGKIYWQGQHIKSIRADCTTTRSYKISQPNSDDYTLQTEDSKKKKKNRIKIVFDFGGGGFYPRVEGRCRFYYTGFDGIEKEYKEEGAGSPDYVWGCECTSDDWAKPESDFETDDED